MNNPQAVNRIVEIDRLLSEGALDEVDAMLEQMDPSITNSSVVLAVLNATFPKREELKARAGFLAKAFDEFEKRYGAARAQRLLRE